jgi:hypothetical protein
MAMRKTPTIAEIFRPLKRDIQQISMWRGPFCHLIRSKNLNYPSQLFFTADCFLAAFFFSAAAIFSL